jgi:hypothetical protein
VFSGFSACTYSCGGNHDAIDLGRMSHGFLGFVVECVVDLHQPSLGVWGS